MLASLKKFRKLLTGFIFLYFIIGLAATPLPRHEIFPFFCWFLFPLTPGEETSYAFRVHRNQGQQYDASQHNQGLIPFKGQTNHIDVHYLARRIGRAIEKNDKKDLEDALTILENQYLSAPYSVELVRIHYHPVKRWKEGKEEINVIKKWEK